MLAGPQVFGRPDRVTVYAGQFTGGIDIRGYGQLFILGSNFNIQPSLIDLRLPTAAKACRPTPKSPLPAIIAMDRPFRLLFEMGSTVLCGQVFSPSGPEGVLFYTPEPASASLFAVSLALPAPAPPARPLLVAHAAKRGAGLRALHRASPDVRHAVRGSSNRHVLAVATRALFRRLTASAPHFAVSIHRRLCIIAAAKGVAAPRPRGRITGLS